MRTKKTHKKLIKKQVQPN